MTKRLILSTLHTANKQQRRLTSLIFSSLLMTSSTRYFASYLRLFSHHLTQVTFRTTESQVINHN